MYYLGSFGISGFVSSIIKTGFKIIDIETKGTFSAAIGSTKILTKIHEIYPYYKNFQNNIYSLYSNNKNSNIFEQDIIM